MTTYTIIGFHGGGRVAIEGETLAEAIRGHWERLRRATIVWRDGGGSTLRTSQVASVSVLPSDPQTTRGGDHFSTIRIVLNDGTTLSNLAVVERPGDGALPTDVLAIPLTQPERTR